jgi:phosphate transport system permease protein
VTTTGFPEGTEAAAHMGRRSRRGTWFRLSFVVALMVAVLALLTLLYNIINSSFGLAVFENEVEPAALVSEAGYDPAQLDLSEVPKDDLTALLKTHLNNNVGRKLERERRFYDDRLLFETQAKWDEVCARAEDRPEGCSGGARDQENVYQLLLEEIVVPQVLETWPLVDSILHRSAIEEEAVAEYPDATLEFRSWLSVDFVTNPQSPEPEVAGVRTAILGSLWIVAVTILFSLPVGVGAAVYLEEYAEDTRLNRLIQTNINNLAGVPSIIYGMLGLAIFVRALEAFTSGSIFGAADGGTANGRTVLAAGLTLGLLILPIIIINAQEAVRAVPQSLRQAGLALGATRWQTVRSHVLPNALPGILTGAILAVARAMGETAPLIVVGASTFITADPSSPFSKFTALPIQIFQWTSRPQDEFRNIAAAAIIVLLVLLLTLNATAIVLRNRYARRM